MCCVAFKEEQGYADKNRYSTPCTQEYHIGCRRFHIGYRLRALMRFALSSSTETVTGPRKTFLEAHALVRGCIILVECFSSLGLGWPALISLGAGCLPTGTPRAVPGADATTPGTVLFSIRFSLHQGVHRNLVRGERSERPMWRYCCHLRTQLTRCLSIVCSS